MKYEAIRANGQQFSIRKMCKVFELAESGYYQWLKRVEVRERNRITEQKVIEEVRLVFEESRKTYGYRRMFIELNKKGINLSEYKVRKIMRETGMYPQATNKYKPGRKGKRSGNIYDNHLEQRFRVKEANEVWAGDITYIKTGLGWVYLAVVMDLYNREVIGYSISKSIDSELVKRALGNALTQRRTAKKGLMFHSDRGIQYSSKSYQRMLDENNIIGSMSRGGCPYDNACVESFFSTAKRECIYRKEYDTMEEVKRDLFDYIELFYNRKRMHRTLGYRSPVEYRQLQLRS
jgi:Transposase and inactivated derivatives